MSGDDNGNGRVTIALLQQGQATILEKLDTVIDGQRENSDRIRDLELAQSGCQSGLQERVTDLEESHDQLEGRVYSLATGNVLLSGLFSLLSALLGK
jgi:hypothetical protein